jgi:hypothetical protein
LTGDFNLSDISWKHNNISGNQNARGVNSLLCISGRSHDSVPTIISGFAESTRFMKLAFLARILCRFNDIIRKQLWAFFVRSVGRHSDGDNVQLLAITAISGTM